MLIGVDNVRAPKRGTLMAICCAFPLPLSLVSHRDGNRIRPRRNREKLLEDHTLVFSLGFVKRRNANDLVGIEMANRCSALGHIDRHGVARTLSAILTGKRQRSIREREGDQRQRTVGRAASQVAYLPDEWERSALSQHSKLAIEARGIGRRRAIRQRWRSAFITTRASATSIVRTRGAAKDHQPGEPEYPGTRWTTK